MLLPVDGFAQGQGQGQGQGGRDQARAADRAQVERGQSDFDRDRIRQRDRDQTNEPAQDRDRTQDRTHAPDTASVSDNDIYGHEYMSVQERNQYREQLQLVESDPEKKTRFEAQHREQMQARAKAQGGKPVDSTEAE
jgi:hypothetical protein